MVLYKFSDDMEINNAPLYNSLLGKLQKDILTGKLKPGQKLTEQNLCKTYGVSRTPVREALRQLETDDEELNAFLFSLGCYSGEPITVVSRRRGGCTVSIKDGRYNIDNQLAEAILI